MAIIFVFSMIIFKKKSFQKVHSFSMTAQGTFSMWWWGGGRRFLFLTRSRVRPGAELRRQL